MKQRTSRIVGIALLVAAVGLVLYALWPDPKCHDLYIKNSGYWTKEVVVKYRHPIRGWRWAGPWVLKKNEGRYADFQHDGSEERVRSCRNTFYVYVGWAPFGLRSWVDPQKYVEKEEFEKVRLRTNSNGDYVLDLGSHSNTGPIIFLLLVGVVIFVWYLKYRHTIYTPDLRR